MRHRESHQSHQSIQPIFLAPHFLAKQETPQNSAIFPGVPLVVEEGVGERGSGRAQQTSRRAGERTSRRAGEQTSRRAADEQQDEQTSQEGLERKCDNNNNKEI